MASLKRRIKKLSKAQAARISGTHFLVCKECGGYEVEVPMDVSAVTCAYCVQRMIVPPPMPKEKSDKPRGWHFKAYFEHEGVVYSKGEPVTDPDEILQLKREHGIEDTPKKSPKKKVAKKKPAKKSPRGSKR